MVSAGRSSLGRRTNRICWSSSTRQNRHGDHVAKQVGRPPVVDGTIVPQAGAWKLFEHWAGRGRWSAHQQSWGDIPVSEEGA